MDSKLKELASFKTNDVFRRVHILDLEPGTQVLDTRWVCSWKDLDGGLRIAKSRLVAKGFQETLDQDEAVDAPTATREGTRLVAFSAVQRGWKLGSIDIKTAFLQADTRGAEDKVIAVRPPKESGEDLEHVWVLNKSMYGLRSAPKAWWKTLTKALTQEFGFRQCINDQAVFTLTENGALRGVLAVHVDDIIFAGDEILMSALETLSLRFAFGSQKSGSFVHLGIEIKHDLANQTVTLGQESYISTLSPIELGPSRGMDSDAPLNVLEQQQLRMLTGSIMWIAGMTRPDISVDASLLAGKLHNPTVQDVLTANKIIRYLKSSSSSVIVYRKLQGQLRVLSYSDSAFQNLPQGRSQAGYAILIAEEETTNSPAVKFQDGDTTTYTRDVRTALMSWKSSRHRRVVRSTFSAELLASSALFDSASWFTSLFTEVTTGYRPNDQHQMPIDLRTDCESLVASTKSLRIQATERRLYGEIWALREALDNSEIRTLKHVPTALMLADGLTKIQPKLRNKLINAMGGYVSIPASKE